MRYPEFSETLRLLPQAISMYGASRTLLSEGLKPPKPELQMNSDYTLTYQNLLFCRVPINSILGFIIRTYKKVGLGSLRYLLEPFEGIVYITYSASLQAVKGTRQVPF